MTDHPIFDAHSDLPFQVVREREAGRRSVVETDFLPGMRAGGIDVRVAAIYVDGTYLPEMALHRGLVIVSELRDDVSESDGVELATTADEIAGAVGTDPVTLVLGMEGSEPLMGDPRLVDAFYRSGLRLLTLTHSRRNAVGDGAPLSGTLRGTPGGLSEAGFGVLERAAELGIVVDLSHLNGPGVYDAIQAVRNLSDEQIRGIAGTDGVVCLTAVGSFLGESPDVETLCDHVEHAVEVAGIEHVGLGFDFFEYTKEYLSETERKRLADIATVDGLETDDHVASVPAALMERGFSEKELSAICHGNVQRVFERVLD